MKVKISADVSIDELADELLESLSDSEVIDLVTTMDDHVYDSDFTRKLIRALMNPLESDGWVFTMQDPDGNVVWRTE